MGQNRTLCVEMRKKFDHGFLIAAFGRNKTFTLRETTKNSRITGVPPNAVNLVSAISPRQGAAYKGLAQSMTSCENGVA
jgi:hypothetical protein